MKPCYRMVGSCNLLWENAARIIKTHTIYSRYTLAHQHVCVQRWYRCWWFLIYRLSVSYYSFDTKQGILNYDKQSPKFIILKLTIFILIVSLYSKWQLISNQENQHRVLQTLFFLHLSKFTLKRYRIVLKTVFFINYKHFVLKYFKH